MLNINNPIAAYKQVNLDMNVESSDPHRLILLLFNGVKSALVAASLHLENGDLPQKGLMISKAIDIINNGLKVSLDVAKGGSLAANLAALYDYMTTRLLYANMKNDPEAIKEVQGLLNEIHSAWEAIGDQVKTS